LGAAQRITLGSLFFTVMKNQDKPINDSPIQILLVEDNLDHALLTQKALQKTNKNFMLDVVASPKDCLDKLSQNNYHLVLTDYSLPIMNGLELLDLIGKSNYDIPVIILTGSGNETVAVDAMKRGAYDYVVKTDGYLQTLDLRIEKVIERYEDKKEKDRVQREKERLQFELQEANKRLELLSITDGLTGVYNYRYLQTKLLEECKRARKYRRNLSCIILDLDHFKSVNDQFGHPFGDLVLKEVTQQIKTILRDTDILGRYGGDEFLIILPETDSPGALLVADRIRLAIKNHVCQYKMIKASTSASLGICSLPINEQITESCDLEVIKNNLIHLADQALYQAKLAGRNQIMVVEMGYVCTIEISDRKN